MAYRTTSTRRSTAKTAVGSQVVIANSGNVTTAAFAAVGGIVSANTSINLGVTTVGSTSSATLITTPTITRLDYLDANNAVVLTQQAVTTLGTGNILITGTGFGQISMVYVNNVLATNTWINSTQIRVTCPATSSGNVNLAIFNLINQGTIRASGIRYSGNPSWTTSAIQVTNAIAANISLFASSDSTLTYTVQAGSTLPTGLSLVTSGYISGTATGYTSNTTVNVVLVATDTEGQATQQSVSILVVTTEPYFKSTTLLLNGETTVTPFIIDASANNFALTIAGDTKGTPFIPYYNDGYYSNLFNGAGDYLTVPSTSIAIGTGDFTLEGWFYFTGTDGTRYDFFANISGFLLYRFTDNTLYVYTDASGTNKITVTGFTSAAYGNKWIHIALTRQSGNTKLFINGTQAGSTFTSDTTNYTGTTMYIGRNGSSAIYYLGYISNFRVVTGNALYTTTFTPSTTPLTAITNTVLLTCQSNRFVDKSVTNSTVTAVGTPRVSPVIPFATPTSVTVNTGNSVYFNGSSDYLTTPSSGTALYMTGNWTIEFWINTSQTARTDVVSPNYTYTGTGWFLLSFGYTTTGASGTIDYIETNGGAAKISGTLNRDGLWHHIALTKSGTSIKLFIDGTQTGSTYTTAQAQWGASGSGWIIGNQYASSVYYRGYISNLRVVNGSALYTTTFTPSTSPLTTTSQSATAGQVSLLTCQTDSMIRDNSINALAITAIGSQVVNNTYPFTQTTATVSNLNTLGGTYFDGTGDYLTAPNSSNNYLGAGDFTVEFWMYCTTAWASNNGPGIGQKLGDSYGGWVVYRNLANVTDKMVIRLAGQGGSGNIDYVTTITPTPNLWQHWAIVRSGTTLTWYCNGIAGGVTTGVSVNVTDTNTAGTMNIGRAQTWGTDFTGYLSNVRVVKGTAVYTSNFAPTYQPLTAITNTQLLTLQYNGGATNSGIIDNSNYNNIITRSGNTSQGSFSSYSQTGWSNYFDGTGDYLSTTNNVVTNLGTGDFTVEFWLNASTTQAGSNPRILSNDVYNTSAGFDIAIDAGLLNFRSAGGIGKSCTFTTGAGDYGIWQHIAFTRSGTSFKVFKNGVLANTYTDSSNLTSANPTYIAKYAVTTGSDFTGYISNLRIVKGTAVYTTTFTPPTSPLTAIANTSLLTCQSNRFVDNSPNNFTLTGAGNVSVQAYSPFGSISEATPLSYSTYFNGSSDYLTAPAGLTTAMGAGFAGNIITIECWVYTPVWTSSALYTQGIIGSYQAVTANGRWYFGVTGSATTGTLRFAYTISSSTQVDLVSTTNTAFLNKWTHVAVTIDATTAASTTVKFFVDGVLTDTFASQNFTTQTAYYTAPYIGGNHSAYLSYWTGYISNLRVVKGTAVYTTTFTPPTAPLTAIANTSLLTCQSTTIIDNSSNNFAITVTGSPKVYKYNPFGYTTQPNLGYTPSIHGGSAYFDGTGDYLSMVQLPIFALSGNYTIEAWVYKTDSGTQRGIVDLRGGVYLNILFFTLTGGQLAAFNSTTTFVQSTGTVPLNQWTHVAITRSGTSVRLFINGVIDGTATNSDVNVSSGPPYIGRQNGSTTADWLGYISDVRVTNGMAIYTSNFVPPTQTLTNYSTTYPASLLCNFTNGGIIDQHSSNVLETVGDAKLSTAVKKYGNASMYFDGAGDYLNVPAGNPLLQLATGDFTVEFWMYGNSVATACSIVDNRNPDTANIAFDISLSSSVLRFTTSGTAFITGTTTLTNGIWYHIAITRSGNTFKLFLNGTQEGTTYTGSTTQNFTNSNFRIGSGANGAFNGYIDDLRIIKGFARYTATFTPTGPNLAL